MLRAPKWQGPERSRITAPLPPLSPTQLMHVAVPVTLSLALTREIEVAARVTLSPVLTLRGKAVAVKTPSAALTREIEVAARVTRAVTTPSAALTPVREVAARVTRAVKTPSAALTPVVVEDAKRVTVVPKAPTKTAAAVATVSRRCPRCGESRPGRRRHPCSNLTGWSFPRLR